VENWIQNGWRTSTKKPVKNIDLWKRLISLVNQHKVTFTWVKGHDGHPENERCDKLATTAADGSNLLDDVVG
jgi:ribonuclease HI